MAASLSIQCAIAGAIVLVSVMSVQRLPLVALPTPLPPLPRAPRVVEVVATEMARAAGSVAIPATAIPRRVFQAPSAIPAKVAMITDDMSLYIGPVATGTGADSGVQGAFLMGDTAAAIPKPDPPKPAHTQAAKQDPTPAKPVEVGGKVQEAKLVHRVMPVYPPLARQARVSGRVQLVAHIGRDGMVREIKVQGGHSLLVAAAVDAVRQWVYSPTLLNGKPVEVIAPVDVNFTLSGN